MHKSIIVLILLTAMQTLVLAVNSQEFVIGTVTNDKGGAGCRFSSTDDSGKLVLFDDAVAEVAWINLDGHDVKIEMVSNNRPSHRHNMEFRADGVKVSLILKVDRKGTETGKLVVKRNGKTKTVKVKGGCGC